jgi:endonuclease-3
VIACAQKLVKDFNGKVPETIDELITLPGVGRKTANVFLSEIGENGIGVDTHVAYIAQALNWTHNKSPTKIELDLKKLFPKKYWNKINTTLVQFGKTHQSRKKKKELLEKIRELR